MKRALWEKEYRERYPADLFILSDDILSGIEAALELDDVEHGSLSNLNFYFGQCSALKYLEAEKQEISCFLASIAAAMSGSFKAAEPASPGLSQFVARGDIQGLKNAAEEALTYKRYALSIMLFSKILDLRPFDEWAYFDLAKTLFRSGKIDQAFEMLEQSKFAGNYSCMLLKADFLKLLSKFDEALAILEELIDQNKDKDSWATYNYLNIKRLLGRQITEERLLRAVRVYGSDLRIQQELAILQSQ